jgi:uncharacterized protein
LGFLAGVASRLRSRALIALALVLWALPFLLLFPTGAASQPKAPPPPKRFFTDSTGVVPLAVAAKIEQRLQTFQKTSSSQVLVVVADRVPAGYTSMEEYTNRTAQAWRVGVKGRDNGAVLFVFVSDRKARIEVGYGLEGALPDGLAFRIINNEITPRFRERNYGAGLLAGVEAIIRATRGEYQPVVAVAPRNRVPTEKPAEDPFTPRLLFLYALSAAFLVYLGYGVYKDVASGGSGGSGGSSDWSPSETSWSSSGSSSSSSSDFSGGGGSFGGGGASGSW